jgi:hypothetical protein
MSNDDYDSRPVGFLGRLRGKKTITWLLIIGLGLITVGGSSFVLLLSQ